MSQPPLHGIRVIGHGTKPPSVRSPVRLSETPLTYERPSPRPGEHTEEILAELEKRD